MKHSHVKNNVPADSRETDASCIESPYNSLYDERSCLIENQISSNEKSVEGNSFSNAICSSLIAMLQGVEVLCYYSILFIYKDNYQLHPATLNIMMCVIRLPWSLKLLWAIISDSYPLFGLRKKYYLLIGSFFCIISMLMLGLIEHTNITLTTGLLMLFFWGSAICNVIGEGQIVENGRRGSENHSAKTVSTFFAFRKFSFAFMAYFSGYLLSVMTKQHIFLLGSILPMAVFFSGFFLTENSNYRLISFKKQLRYVVDIVKIPPIKNSIIFIFIMMSTPSCGNNLFYFMTNKLNFSPELLGKMTMFQSIASVVAIVVYILFFTKTDIRKLLLYSTLIVTPFCLLPLIVIYRWNKVLYIPDSIFITTDTVLLEFVGEFQTIPLLVLCSHIIPDGLESTVYSLLLTVNNIASAISSFGSSVLTYGLNITATDFTNLPLMIIICAVTNLLPIFFVYILPKTSQRRYSKLNNLKDGDLEKVKSETEKSENEKGENEIKEEEWGKEYLTDEHLTKEEDEEKIVSSPSTKYNVSVRTESPEDLLYSGNKPDVITRTIFESSSEATTLKDNVNSTVCLIKSETKK